jgi:hypothetical protein
MCEEVITSHYRFYWLFLENVSSKKPSCGDVSVGLRGFLLATFALFLRAAQALIILLCTSCSKFIQCTRSSLERKQPTQKPFGPDWQTPKHGLVISKISICFKFYTLALKRYLTLAYQGFMIEKYNNNNPVIVNIKESKAAAIRIG